MMEDACWCAIVSRILIQQLSAESNMSSKYVNVWGQTTRSWPSYYSNVRLTTNAIRYGRHNIPTYMVGSYKSVSNRFKSRLSIASEIYPMAIYYNGTLLGFKFQSGRKNN